MLTGNLLALVIIPVSLICSPRDCLPLGTTNTLVNPLKYIPLLTKRRMPENLWHRCPRAQGQFCWVTVYIHILALSEYCQMLSRITTWICRLAGVNDIYILDHSLLLVLTLQVSSFKRSLPLSIASFALKKKKSPFSSPKCITKMSFE